MGIGTRRPASESSQPVESRPECETVRLSSWDGEQQSIVYENKGMGRGKGDMSAGGSHNQEHGVRFGSIERNKSNGENAVMDQTTIDHLMV